MILYSCEAWREKKKKNHLLNDIETFHVHICKQKLGLPKHACNAVELFKLGRILLLVLEQRQTFKYLQRLPFFRENILLYFVLREEIQQDDMG